MAQLLYPTRMVGLAGAALPAAAPQVAGKAAANRSGLVSGLGKNWQLIHDTSGTVTGNNRVMLKADPSAPELPFAGARVRLHRLSDGYCAWQGHSDSNGYYWPRGLEVGELYYPVAIDLTGAHECDAAGPVLAVQAA